MTIPASSSEGDAFPPRTGAVEQLFVHMRVRVGPPPVVRNITMNNNCRV